MEGQTERKGGEEALPEEEIFEDPMGEEKVQKSEEEKKGLLSAIFSQGKSFFASSPKGGVSAPGASGEEEQLTAATQEFLARAAAQCIEYLIKWGIKDVEDFEESKGATFGEQLIDVFTKSMIARADLEKDVADQAEQLQEQDFYIQKMEAKLAEANRENGALKLQLERAGLEKEAANQGEHGQEHDLSIQAIKAQLAEANRENGALKLQLQQALDEKRCAEEGVKTALGAEGEGSQDAMGRGAWSERYPTMGAGRSSTFLRNSSTTGTVCMAGNIVESLMDAPVRAAANAMLDKQMKASFAQLAEMTKNQLRWAGEAARVSLKQLTLQELDTCYNHIDKAIEQQKAKGECTKEKMGDFAHFCKVAIKVLQAPGIHTQRGALMDALFAAEEKHGDVDEFITAYVETANRFQMGLNPKELKEAAAAIQDDGRILGRIIEKVAVPLSKELEEQIAAGDRNNFGSKDVNDTWVRACTMMVYAKRHLVNRDVLAAIGELLTIFDGRKETLTMTCNKRLSMFRQQIREAMIRWEKKYDTEITGAMMLEAMMAEAYLKNAKPCPTIAKFFDNMKNTEQYQGALQSFEEYKKVMPQFTKAIEAYDDNNGQHKHGKKENPKDKGSADKGSGDNRFTNAGDKRIKLERPGFGRGRGDRGALIPQAFLNQMQEIVAFAAKTEHKPCPKCGFEHPLGGACAKADNQKVKNDHAAPYLQRLAASDNKEERLKLGKEMLAAALKGAENTYKKTGPPRKNGKDQQGQRGQQGRIGAAGGSKVAEKDRAPLDLIKRCRTEGLCIDFELHGKCGKPDCPFKHQDRKTGGKQVSFKGTGFNMMNYLTNVTNEARHESGAGPVADVPVGTVMSFPFASHFCYAGNMICIPDSEVSEVEEDDDAGNMISSPEFNGEEEDIQLEQPRPWALIRRDPAFRAREERFRDFLAAGGLLAAPEFEEDDDASEDEEVREPVERRLAPLPPPSVEIDPELLARETNPEIRALFGLEPLPDNEGEVSEVEEDDDASEVSELELEEEHDVQEGDDDASEVSGLELEEEHDEARRDINLRILKRMDWVTYAHERLIRNVLRAWQVQWQTVPGVFKPRDIVMRPPKIVMTMKVAKVAQGERTVEEEIADIHKMEKKRVMRVNRIANLWRKLARNIKRAKQPKKTEGGDKRTLVKQTTAQTVVECIDPPSTKRKLMRYVIPMREASFLPGEETGVRQFGKSGKGRFFPADFFFASLELRGSKRERQVRQQVRADWSTRAKLTRRWTTILHKRRSVRQQKIRQARSQGSAISWISRMGHIKLLKGTSLPNWTPFVIDECLGYIDCPARMESYVLWGDPLPKRSGNSKGMVAYSWPEEREIQREGFPFYAQQPNKYVGLRNHSLSLQEGVIVPVWEVQGWVPPDPYQQAEICKLFGWAGVRSAANITWAPHMGPHYKQPPQPPPRRTYSRAKEEEGDWMIHLIWERRHRERWEELRKYRLFQHWRALAVLGGRRQRLQIIDKAFQSWTYWKRELSKTRSKLDRAQNANTCTASGQFAIHVQTLKQIARHHEALYWDHHRKVAMQRAAFQEWKTRISESAVKATPQRSTTQAEVFAMWDRQFQILDEGFQRWRFGTEMARGKWFQSQTWGLRARTRLEAAISALGVMQQCFQLWSAWALDGAAEKEYEMLEQCFNYWKYGVQVTPPNSQERLAAQAHDDSDSMPGLIASSSESDDEWPLPRMPDRSGATTGTHDFTSYVTEHWSPYGPISPRGSYTQTGLQSFSLTVPIPAGTFDGNEAHESLLMVPNRLDTNGRQRCRQALQAWRRLVRRRRRPAARKGKSGSDTGDDTDSESGGDGNDGRRHTNNEGNYGSGGARYSNIADQMTRPLPAATFGSVLRQLFARQLPLPWAPHPLSTFMRMEAYRRFSYSVDSGEYTAFEVPGHAAVYLASFTANAQPGVRMWLVDSGSSCFVTPFRDTMILPIRTELQMNGIGGAHSKMVSPLILSFLDAEGKYAVLHFQCVFLLETLPIPLFATGPCEQQGWSFCLNASSPCATMPDGRCVPLFRDRVTGFHWLAERLQALPTIKGRRAVVSKCLEQPNQTGLELEYVPELNCAKQRTKLEDAERLPTQHVSQYRHDKMMASQHSLGGGQRAHAIAAVNTRAQVNEARKQQSDKDHDELMQNLWKDVVQGKLRGIPEPKAEAKSEEESENFQEEEAWQEAVDKKMGEAQVKSESKRDSDDSFFKKEKLEKRSSPQNRPLRLRIPRTRWLDTNQPKDTQKAAKFLHEALGHLSMSTIKEGLKVVKGYESIANIIEVMPDDRHCNACAVGKSKMPPIPKGKTVRLSPVNKEFKVYVDLSGHIEEPSIWHNYHYYLSICTEQGFSYIRGLRSRSQALLVLAQIFAESGNPRTVQIDGEGGLANDVAADFFASRGIHVVKSEAYAHFRNGKIERRHQTWKGMARAMLNRAGMSISFWWFAMRQAVLISNLILLETPLGESESESRRSIWEAHFGETPHLDSYVLGPFGCLAFLILTKEQRQARGLCGHFGNRTLQGLYLGAHVDAASGVFRHLFTDGRTVFSTPHALKVVGDGYPLYQADDSSSLIPTIEEPNVEQEGGIHFDGSLLAMVIEQAKAQKEREVQLYLNYNREAMTESDEAGASEGTLVCAAMRNEESKPKRQTRLKGDERRTGKKVIEPTRIVSAARDGAACHKRLDERLVEEKGEMIHPNQVDTLEPWPEEFILEKPYPGAKYDIAVCHDYSEEARTPSGLKDPYSRFVGRKVRKYFETNNLKHRHRMKAIEGVVEKFMKGKNLFRVRYHIDDSTTDREDLDLAALEDVLIMGRIYGDGIDMEGKTRDEVRRAEIYTAIYAEAQEEIFHNNVPDPELEKLLASGSAFCFTAVPGEKPIYDDEPRNAKEVDMHPEREAILASAEAEINQFIEQAIGVEVTKEEVADFVEKGGKVLNAKFVYKRKYAIVQGVEQFLKWKSRMAVVGCAERQGWETVYSTFSPTVAFAAIRLLIALTVDEKYTVDSYDLSGAFLGTELRDRAVYIKLPADAGVHAGKILLLKKSVYGLKTSGKDFIEQLAEEILGFVVEVKCTRTGKVTKHSFKRVPVDHCVFRLEDGQGRILLLLHYVDDLVLASTDTQLRDDFLKHINRRWNTTHEGRLARFLGINYTWSVGSCTCNAAAYIERIARRFDIMETRLPDSPIDAGFEITEADFEIESTPEQISVYRSLIGSIGYAATTCRFDVSYAMSMLSRHLAKPNTRLIEAAKRVIKYLLKTKDLGITWKVTPEDKTAGFANTLFGATDASFAMCPLTRKSHAGYVLFMNHGVVSYKSKLQNIVTLSSAESEFVALSDVTCEIKYLRELSRGLGYPQREATLVFEDNRAAILVAQSECSASGRMRHVDVKFRFVMEAVKNKEIRVRYIQTDLNFADLFTKACTPKKHTEGVKAILGDKDAYRIAVGRPDADTEEEEVSRVMMLECD